MKWHPLLPPPTRAVSRPNSFSLPFRRPKFFPINKKKLGTLFFVHFFTVVLHDYNVKLRNFLGTRFFKEMLNVFLFTFFSLPLIFTLVAASISPFSHRRFKIFMFFFQRNWSPLVFLSCSSSFSVIRTLKLSPKKESAFVTKRPGSYAIYRRNARVLEMQNFIPAYTKRWTHVRTYPVRTIFSEPKFLGCIDY